MWDDSETIIVAGIVLIIFAVVLLAVSFILDNDNKFMEMTVNDKPCIVYVENSRVQAMSCDWSIKDE